MNSLQRIFKRPRSIINFLIFTFMPWTSMAQSIEEMSPNFIRQNWSYKSNTIYISSQLWSEVEWLQSPEAFRYEILPGYKSLKDLDPVSGSENLEVFHSETAFLVSRAKVEQFFAKKSHLEILKIMDVGFRHRALESQSANEQYQNNLKTSLDAALNTLGQRAQRSVKPLNNNQYIEAQKNLESQWETNRQVQWCHTAGSQCLTSEVNFSGSWSGLIDTLRALPSDGLLNVPTEIVMLSEIKPLEPQLAPLAHLEKPAQQGFVVTGFLANSFLQYSQMVVSVHPVDEKKSLVIIQSTVGLEKDDLDKLETGFLSARSILMGASIYNGDDGFSMGLPRVQQTMAEQLFKSIK